jgi:hypothetical protein
MVLTVRLVYISEQELMKKRSKERLCQFLLMTDLNMQPLEAQGLAEDMYQGLSMEGEAK